MILIWGSAGGCGPYTGTITATYKGESGPYAKYEITVSTGKQTDTPSILKPCREGTFTIVYTLSLRDYSGQTVTANATAEVSWIC